MYGLLNYCHNRNLVLNKRLPDKENPAPNIPTLTVASSPPQCLAGHGHQVVVELHPHIRHRPFDGELFPMDHTLEGDAEAVASSEKLWA